VIIKLPCNIYKAREKGKIPSLSFFKNLLSYQEKIEYNVAKSKKLISLHLNKWSKITNALRS